MHILEDSNMELPIFRKQKTENREQKTFSDSRISAHRSLTSGLGFTLIELLIVIAIIGILISIGLASFSRAQTQSRDSQRKADLQNMAGAMEQYYADENQYPSSINNVVPKYMRALPKNPTGGNYSDSTNYITATSSATIQTYCLVENLEIDPSSQTTCPADSVDYDFVVSSRD